MEFITAVSVVAFVYVALVIILSFAAGYAQNSCGNKRVVGQDFLV